MKTKTPQNGLSATDESKTISLPAIDIRQVTFQIIGLTPLIVNKFSDKAKQQMLEKQTKSATKGRAAKVPTEQFESSIYYFEDKKRTGFPAVGFKAAMVRAGKQLGMNMTDSRGRFHVLADENELIVIKGKAEMREDMVRLATGVADIRFRGCYYTWGAQVTISYNATVISEEQLAQLLNMAGFSCGIGEWRPEKSNSGSYGMFKII